MSNPYEPPLHFIDRIEILVYSPNTFLQRLLHAVYFSAESVLGLNAGVAVDEGISSTLVPPCLCVKKKSEQAVAVERRNRAFSDGKSTPAAH